MIQIDEGDLEFDIPTVNREAIVLEPTDAYAKWARSCPGEDTDATLAALKEEGGAVYLIPATNDTPDIWLKCNYKILFEEELWGWCTDKAFWPKDRSFKLFKKFFKIGFHSMVMDTCDFPLERDY